MSSCVILSTYTLYLGSLHPSHMVECENLRLWTTLHAEGGHRDHLNTVGLVYITLQIRVGWSYSHKHTNTLPTTAQRRDMEMNNRDSLLSDVKRGS